MSLKEEDAEQGFLGMKSQRDRIKHTKSLRGRSPVARVEG